jgi:hypothetical protein
MSTWRCGSICPRSYLFAAVFLAGVVVAHKPLDELRLWDFYMRVGVVALLKRQDAGVEDGAITNLDSAGNRRG